MIAKIMPASSDHGGALRYVLGKDGAEVLLGGSIQGSGFQGLKRQFDVLRSAAQTDSRKLVFHGVLSVPPDESRPGQEALTPTDWSAIGKRFMTELGYKDSPFVLVKHTDTDHAHVHIVGLAVNGEGKLVRRHQEWNRSRKVLNGIEADYGLRPAVPNQQPPPRRPPSAKELNEHLRKAGEGPNAQASMPRQLIWSAYDRAVSTLQSAPELPTMAGFARALAHEGVRLSPNVSQTTDRVAGLRYVHEESGRSFTAGRLGADATLGGLAARGVTLEPADIPRLREARSYDLVTTGRAPTEGLAGATAAKAALAWQSYVHGGAREPVQVEPSQPSPSTSLVAGATPKEVHHQVREHIRNHVDEALQNSSLTLSAFIERLGKRGVDVELNASSTTGRVSGLTYVVGEHRMKASKVGKPYGLPALQQRGLTDVRTQPTEPISTPSLGAAESGTLGADAALEASDRGIPHSSADGAARGDSPTESVGAAPVDEHASLRAELAASLAEEARLAAEREQRELASLRAELAELHAHEAQRAQQRELVDLQAELARTLAHEQELQQAHIRHADPAGPSGDGTVGHDHPAYDGSSDPTGRPVDDRPQAARADADGRSVAEELAFALQEHVRALLDEPGSSGGVGVAPHGDLGGHPDDHPRPPGASGAEAPFPSASDSHHDGERHDDHAVDPGGLGSGRGRAGDAGVAMTANDVQRQIIRQVTDALDAPAYRVTVMQDGRGINLTRPGGKEAQEQPVDAQGLLDLSPALGRFNAQGWNVYITPLSETHHFLVVDDLEGDNQGRFAGLGYRPAILQETSPGNQQAVLRVPIDAENPPGDERAAANAWVRKVNQDIGDAKFTGAVHPFRLAGFTNRKDAYQQDNGYFPFVRTLAATDRDCDRAAEELQQLRPLHQGVERSARQATEARDGDPITLPTGELAAGLMETHRLHRERVEDHVERKGWVRDESKIDFHVAHALTREGFDVSEVAQAIRTLSPNLDERHRDAETYALRTASAAADHEAHLLQRARNGGPDIDR